ncbi:purine-nucleoside phosphorylase [soil metagenome]
MTAATALGDFPQIEEASASIRAAFGDIPPILVVAGSGLGGFADTLSDRKDVSYGDLKHFPVSSVVGHAGKLVKGLSGGRPVILMNGRKHLYEGVDVREAVLPLRALLNAGVKTVILSNAAGCLNAKYNVGDLMLITDHVNNMFKNPLIGKNDDRVGPRFPDMSEPYCRSLQKIARDAAAEQKIVLREGVYVGNLGPSYETQAEVQMLRVWADAVGMSTVPETTVAVHAGAKVLGISLLTNSLVARTDAKTTHEEVLEAGRDAAAKFSTLVTAIIGKLPA